MTFQQFLTKIRKDIGQYCPDEYWAWKFKNLSDQSEEGVNKEMPFLAVNAVGDDYASKNAGKRQQKRRK